MRIKIEATIEVDGSMWFNDKDEFEWFKSMLNDKDETMVILWSNDVGDEIGQTSDFKYEIL
jgi:hypothetical protein